MPGCHPSLLSPQRRPWVLASDPQGCFLALPCSLVPFAWLIPTCCLLRESNRGQRSGIVTLMPSSLPQIRLKSFYARQFLQHILPCLRPPVPDLDTLCGGRSCSQWMGRTPWAAILPADPILYVLLTPSQTVKEKSTGPSPGQSCSCPVTFLPSKGPRVPRPGWTMAPEDHITRGFCGLNSRDSTAKNY